MGTLHKGSDPSPYYGLPIIRRRIGRVMRGSDHNARLVDIGILREITGRARNRRFRYDAYVSLFDEPAAAVPGAPA